ncbi:MAG: hypothetical protein NE327_14995 [Lentisphaeraceae bacterium]|nr:hypothetical protein [Lentisphaeraceae bacterium]
MADNKAKVSSIEVIESMHQFLSTFSEETLSVLDSINTEVQRRLSYLENEVAGKWRQEYEKWKEKQREAMKELSVSRTSTGKISAEQQLRQAKIKIRECEEKLAKISEWMRRIPTELPLPQSRLLKLKTYIVNDVEKGRILLKEYFNTLREYTEIKGKNEI